jgi:hypothetical protein
VSVDGDVLLGDSAAVRGSVSGAQITVSGAVLGDLRATEAVMVQNGARVQGDIVAPRIGIADGGLVRGNVRTEGEASLAPAARRTGFGTRPFGGFGPQRPGMVPARSTELRSIERPDARGASGGGTERSSEARAAETRPVDTRPSEAKNKSEGEGPSTKSAAEPPPPIVPVLPKGARGKKKNRS